MGLVFDYTNRSVDALRFENLPSAPVPGFPGRMVFNSTTLNLLIDTGTILAIIGQIDNTETLSADSLTASSANTNLTLSPSGTATSVVVAPGKNLTVDRISTTTSSTDLVLSATGSNVNIDTGKFLKIVDALSGAVPFFNGTGQMVVGNVGSSTQVLTGGSMPSFGSVTSSMVDASIIIASGANVFTGNQDFGNHQALNFRAENVSSDPSPGNPGRLIWNTTSSLLKIDNGSTFNSVSENFRLYVSTTSDSSAIINTNAPTFFNQQMTIPANAISAGSVIKLYAAGTVSNDSGTVILLLNTPGGSINLLSPNGLGGGDLWQADVTITCRNSSGSLYIFVKMFCAPDSIGGPGVLIRCTQLTGSIPDLSISTTFGFGVKYSATSFGNFIIQNQLVGSVLTSV